MVTPQTPSFCPAGMDKHDVRIRDSCHGQTGKQGSETIAISLWEFVRHERMNSQHSIAGTAGPRVAPRRRRYPRRRAAARPLARRPARRERRASRPRIAARTRPRAHAPAGRDRAAAARHAALSARSLSRARHPEGFAAGRDRAADRRRPDPVARRARPRRGRPVGPAGTGGPARRGLCGADQRRAAARGAERRPAVARQGHRRARHPGLADGALAARLRRRAGARRSPPPTARSRRSTSR